MSDETEDHPVPHPWSTSEAYRRALAIADIARRAWIADREREQARRKAS